MWKKMRDLVADSCDKLELVMALLVLVATIVGIVSLWEPFMEFVENRYDMEALLDFMGYVLNVVIVIEFLKMLSHPSPDTVLEVLIFLVARHMIIIDTSVVENFVSIISVAVLFAMKRFLKLPVRKDQADIFVSDFDGDKQRKKTKEHSQETFKDKAKQLAENVKDMADQ